MRFSNNKSFLILTLLLGVVVMAALVMAGGDAKQAMATNADKSDSHEKSEATTVSQNSEIAVAIFGAGCFWGVEAAFRQIEGVVATQVGYAGGHTEKPSYHDVCSGTTGHAEVVRVEYDPGRVSYNDLLQVFWENHDPTQVNRQGPDVGEQYRSVIFYTTPEQQQIAQESKDSLEASGAFKKPIATRIEKADDFWLAEEYHQQYLEKRGLSTCRIK